jgi:hypothetical protein
VTASGKFNRLQRDEKVTSVICCGLSFRTMLSALKSIPVKHEYFDDPVAAYDHLVSRYAELSERRRLYLRLQGAERRKKRRTIVHLFRNGDAAYSKSLVPVGQIVFGGAACPTHTGSLSVMGIFRQSTHSFSEARRRLKTFALQLSRN